MNKDELKELLKRYLTIETFKESFLIETSIKVKILFDGEEITSDTFCVATPID